MSACGSAKSGYVQVMAKRKSNSEFWIELGVDVLTEVARRAHGIWKKSQTPKIEETAPSQQPAEIKPRRPRAPTKWWKVLGVSQFDSKAEISKAYRKLMQQNHPDKVAHLSPKLQKVAEKEAKRLNDAYETGLKEWKKYEIR